jgi:hypothetical protein
MGFFKNSIGANGFDNWWDPGGLFHNDDSAAQKAQAHAGHNRDYQRRRAASRINSIFDSDRRQNQYDQLVDSVTQYYTDAINRQHDNAQRHLKFNLASSGLTGGSVQADQNQRMGEDYSTALLNATRRGVRAGQTLKAQDEALRESLLGQVNAGINATAPAQTASNRMRANLEYNRRPVEDLGNIFGDVLNVYQKRQQNNAYKQARQQFIDALYGRGQ